MDTRLFEKLVSIRRHLHQDPELSFTEFKTAAFVENQLTELGIPHERIALTGIIATLTKGEGPTIILRADMDALPITEESGVPFPSQTKGIMHACGHDIHVAVQLGVASILSSIKDQVPGTIQFIFQPHRPRHRSL